LELTQEGKMRLDEELENYKETNIKSFSKGTRNTLFGVLDGVLSCYHKKNSQLL
jgi:hypothetical protein